MLSFNDSICRAIIAEDKPVRIDHMQTEPSSGLLMKRSGFSKWLRGGSSSSHNEASHYHVEYPEPEPEFEGYTGEVEEDCPSQAELESLYPEDPIASMKIAFDRDQEIEKEIQVADQEEYRRQGWLDSIGFDDLCLTLRHHRINLAFELDEMSRIPYIHMTTNLSDRETVDEKSRQMILSYDECLRFPRFYIEHPGKAHDLSMQCNRHRSEMERYLYHYNQSKSQDKRKLYACMLIEGREFQERFAEMQKHFKELLKLAGHYS